MGTRWKNMERFWLIHTDSFCHICHWNLLGSFLASLGLLCPYPGCSAQDQISQLPPLWQRSGSRRPQPGSKRQRHQALAQWHDSAQQNQLLAWIQCCLPCTPARWFWNQAENQGQPAVKPSRIAPWAAWAGPEAEDQPLNPICHHSRASGPSRNAPETLSSWCPSRWPGIEADRPAQHSASGLCWECSSSQSQAWLQGQAAAACGWGGAECAGDAALSPLTAGRWALPHTPAPSRRGPAALGALALLAGCWTSIEFHINISQLSVSVYQIKAFTRVK